MEKKGVGRPRVKITKKRMFVGMTVSVETYLWLEEEVKRTGENYGRVVDSLVTIWKEAIGVGKVEGGADSKNQG